jgi:signal transduction histidine kinase/CheY-like chemotaxis protein
MPSHRPFAPPDFRALFESAPGLYLALTTDLRIIAVTDAYLAATMTTREGILGRPLFEVFPANPSVPSATGIDNLRASLERVLQTRRAHIMAVQEYDIRRPAREGGAFEERWWSATNSPVLGPGDTIEYIIHRVEDVTDLFHLKQLGSHHDELTQALRQRAEQVQTEVDLQVPRLAEANVLLRMANAVLGNLYRQIEHLTNQADRDLRVGVRQDGPSGLPVAITPEEMLNRVGKLITRRNQLEEQLLHSQKMEAVGCLAGGIAHDFNNLLTVILGYSGMLRDSLSAGDDLQSVVEIEKAATRAASLTGQLLAFSRKQVLQLRVLDLNSVVAGMKEMLERLIGEDIELDIELASRLDNVKADSGQIEQVVMNLAVNARDAMPAGGRLRIATRNGACAVGANELLRMQPGPCVILCVSDNGAGMDAETQARVFEPFFTTKESGKGTGLGLSTVYGIVQQCGGAITVGSQPGHGATFTVYLPVTAESARPEPPPSAAPRSRSRSGTVLIVEDEASVRKLARATLARAGYQVLEAASGPAGLALSRSYAKRIDLLLTDIVMLGMNGLQLAESIRQDRGDMIVLFMSGYDESQVGRHPAGASNFLPKPFTPRSLLNIVATLLGTGQKTVPAAR